MLGLECLAEAYPVAAVNQVSHNCARDRLVVAPLRAPVSTLGLTRVSARAHRNCLTIAHSAFLPTNQIQGGARRALLQGALRLSLTLTLGTSLSRRRRHFTLAANSFRSLLQLFCTDYTILPTDVDLLLFQTGPVGRVSQGLSLGLGFRSRQAGAHSSTSIGS
ncbi:hypothetical protein SprV_0501858100 [Sparganum proliferum]